tara:strand:- start:938 stop:1234 length:297 start_codon:yes stop_codon:yes gene_type:complete
LDSLHTHEHVLQELKLYSKFVSKNSYLVVFDTTVETFDKESVKIMKKKYPHKGWNIGHNPRSAIKEFLKENKSFNIDYEKHAKAQITCCFEGFLKKIK